MDAMKKFLVLANLVCLISCGALDDAKENAEKAADNSGRAAQSAEESREEIARGRVMSRAGGASLAREEYFRNLMDHKYTPTFHGKTVQASKYFKALEFQIWTGLRYDVPEFREELYEEAINELFRRIKDLTDGESLAEFNANPLGIGNKDNANAIMAIAVNLHQKNNFQEYVLASKQKEVKQFSFLDVLEQSVERSFMVDKGIIIYEDLKGYEQAAFRYRNDFRELLNLRYNMLSIMALSETSEMGKSLAGMYEFFKMRYMGWVTNFIDLSVADQHAVNKWLANAIKAKKMLKKLGREAVMFKNVSKRFEKMELPSDSDVSNKFQQNSNIESIYNEYLSNIKNL